MTGTGARDDAVRQLHAVLTDKAAEVYGSGATVQDLTRLSGGASRETWSFDVITPAGAHLPLILKRDPVIHRADGSIVSEETRLGVQRATEGRLMELAAEAGVPVPEVPFYLAKDRRTSAGFIMQRLQGEALGRRLLREDAYAEARRKLAFQCGHAAARLHGIAVAGLPELKSMNVSQALDHGREIMESSGHPYPGFEYGFRWLEERQELAGDRHTLVHGDFRNGNFLVGADGLRGVLDWESAHIGNPLNDLGWICVRSWRYGHFKKPVGGFGEISDLQAGYEAGGGGRVGAEAIRYWEVFGTVHWGMLCIFMAFSHLDGPHASFEKAVIGRRTAETEYDLMQLLD
ncbi:MAG: phosphotransferase family protein [Alphaproteobacteria bacterium]|nr:phosphotransferase family protein [Alphaproteobacteria bacterium]MDP6816377.1 phosphotransferase family protein [Alphaproteobacteria bacterium]